MITFAGVKKKLGIELKRHPEWYLSINDLYLNLRDMHRMYRTMIKRGKKSDLDKYIVKLVEYKILRTDKPEELKDYLISQVVEIYKYMETGKWEEDQG